MPLQNQFRDNEKIQLTLAEITARLGDTKQANHIITPFLKSSDLQSRANTKPYVALINYEETKIRQAIDQYHQLEKKNVADAKIYLTHLKIKYPLSTLVLETQPTPVMVTSKPAAPIFIVPTIKRPPTENDLMNNYYALKRENDPTSDVLLKKISSQFQNDFDAQMEMGYTLLAQHRNKEALPYFLKAQEIRPGDFELANQIGFILNNNMIMLRQIFLE